MEEANANSPVSTITGTIVLIILGLAWLGFLAYTGYTLYQRWQLVNNGVVTIGSVVSVREDYDSENDTTDYIPTIAYEVDGQSYEFEASGIGDPNEFLVGKNYEVLYQAGNPGNGRLNFAWDIWLTPAIMTILATAPLWVAILIAIPGWLRRLRGDASPD